MISIDQSEAIIRVTWPVLTNERPVLPHPLDCLPAGDQPDVLHLGDCVKEQLKPLLVVRSGEPGIREYKDCSLNSRSVLS